MGASHCKCLVLIHKNNVNYRGKKSVKSLTRWCSHYLLRVKAPINTEIHVHHLYIWLSGWWFGTFLITFHIIIGNNHTNWRTHFFQRARYTTNQYIIFWISCHFEHFCPSPSPKETYIVFFYIRFKYHFPTCSLFTKDTIAQLFYQKQYGFSEKQIGLSKKNINLPLNITFEYDVFQHVVKLQLFLGKKHQKTWIFCPKTRHPQDLLRTAGFVPDSVVSAADLPTEIAATDCDEEADMVSPRKWISDGFGTWKFGVYAHHMAFPGEKW